MTLDIDRPFRARDAAAAKISRRRLQSDEFRRLARGIYISPRVRVDARVEAEAALMVAGRGAFASHHLAARLHGGIVPDVAPLHVSVPRGRHRSRVRDVIVHESSRTPVKWQGLLVTSPEDTFVDLAAHLDLVDLVILGDSLVRRGRTTVGRLTAAVASGPSGHRALAIRAAALVREQVDSAMETRTRLLVVLAGLPEPEVNICFRDEYGHVVRRIDLGYRRHRLGIEYDGRHHVEVVDQWHRDIARDEEFDELRWRRVKVVSPDIFRSPDRTIDRIVSAMKQQGMRVPPRSDEWRAHFRGR